MEDPFELTHDLGRVVDRDTLRDVRSEIDRADVLLSEQRGTWEKLTEKYAAKEQDKPKPKPNHGGYQQHQQAFVPGPGAFPGL